MAGNAFLISSVKGEETKRTINMPMLISMLNLNKEKRSEKL